MCLQLLNTAEKAWCRALAMWVLYGEIPGDALGMEDFFIREVTGDEHSAGDRLQETVCRQRTFEIKEDLMPDFVTPETAASILFIGKSLNALKASSSATTFSSSSSPSPSSALPTSSYTGADLSSITLRNSHTTSLSSLPSPISPTDLTAAVSEIRRSLLSQSPLLQLLPLPAILDILHLLHDYLLLNQGDFAVTLVRFADEVVKNRHLRPDGRVMKKHRDEDGGDDDEWDSENLIDSIRDLFVKPAEVEQVLAQTWAEMYALQGGDDTNDNGRLELARQSITLEFDVLPYQKKHHQQQQEQELHQQRPTSSPSAAHTSIYQTYTATPTYDERTHLLLAHHTPTVY
ncbi:hypothetical protein KEM54_003793 [Ascosphaera aggregata]|nr:hypothetical protein KEM54_003793 [Ascosphaera aggregata]